VSQGDIEAEASAERPRGVRTKSAWLLALPFLVLARPSSDGLWAGALLTGLGLALRAWAAGIIHKDERLTTTGPYAYLRHPLYVGSFVIGMGLAVAGGQWIWSALVVAYFVAVYRRTTSEEGERLTRLFGARYAEYAADVPPLVPRLTPYRPADAAGGPDEGFALARYLRHREWEALLGVTAAFLLLAAKLRWLG